jgi:hypothetical protein
MQKLTISIAVLALTLSAAVALDQFTSNYLLSKKPGGLPTFEISNLKLDSQVQSYGGATLSIRAVVRETSSPSSAKLMLILKRKVTFAKTGAVRESQDAVLISEGTGLVDSSQYLTSEDVKSIGSDLSSATVTWEPIGIMPIVAAKVEIK